MKYIEQKKVFFLLSYCLFSLSTFSISQEEEKEIKNIKEQIAILQKRLETLEEKKAIENSAIEKRKIGLVLSGGGAKGYAHLSLLRFLEKQHIQIDYITGTSIGAFIGTLYSIGYSVDEIEACLNSLNYDSLIKNNAYKRNPHDILTVNYDKQLNFSYPKGLASNEFLYLALKDILKSAEGIQDFNTLPIPLRIIATDLNTGKAKAFDSGDLAQVLTASMAVPTLLEPVKIGDTSYVDGLISRNFPVQDVIEMGANFVIGSDVGNELKDNSDYNILSVLNQLIAIQSSSSHEEQKELVDILIQPKIQKYSALDIQKREIFLKLGEEAVQENKEALLSCIKKESKTPKKILSTPAPIFFEKLVLPDNFQGKVRMVIEEFLSDIIGKELKEEELRDKILRVYRLPFISKVYYKKRGNELFLDGEVIPENTLGIGFHYQKDYGTTFRLGTNLHHIGKFGNTTNINAKIGDYLGLDIYSLFHYGISDEVGLFSRLSYDERPFYLYERNRRLASFKKKIVKGELGIFTRYRDDLFLSAGLSTNYAKLNLESGDTDYRYFEYSKNFNNAFLRFKFDNVRNRKSGLKAEAEYKFSASSVKKNSNVYGPSYQLDGYFPISPKLTGTYHLSGGIMIGNRIPIDQYFKIGGLQNNMELNEFSFYGYRPHQKIADKFMIGNLGLQYEILSNIYWTGNWNMMAYHSPIETLEKTEKKWRRYIHGFASSLMYDSPLGPIELSISRNNQEKEFLTTFSIGYYFY